MSSIRLRTDQTATLKSKPMLGAHIIRSAITRFKRGEIVIQNGVSHKKRAPLEVFPIRRKPEGYSDAELRGILDAHFDNPVDFSAEIEAMDRQIWMMIGDSETYLKREGFKE